MVSGKAAPTGRPSKGVARSGRRPAEQGSPAPLNTRAPAGGYSKPPAMAAVVRSPWGWRILAVFSLVALGLCVTFLLDGHTGYGAAWGFITVAWGTFTGLLWRRHLTSG